MVVLHVFKGVIFQEILNLFCNNINNIKKYVFYKYIEIRINESEVIKNPLK